MMKDLGFVNIDIDVKKYSDLSLIEAAAARLKMSGRSVIPGRGL